MLLSIHASLASISLNQRQGPMVLDTLNTTVKKPMPLWKNPWAAVIVGDNHSQRDLKGLEGLWSVLQNKNCLGGREALWKCGRRQSSTRTLNCCYCPAAGTKKQAVTPDHFQGNEVLASFRWGHWGTGISNRQVFLNPRVPKTVGCKIWSVLSSAWLWPFWWT